MNFINPLVIASVIFILGFIIIAAYEAFGVAGIVLFAWILAATMWSTYRRSALVSEMEIGVVFNRFNDSFSRFVVGPQSKPVRLKWFEEVRYKIPKKSQTVGGKLDNMRTAEGIPVSIFWKVSYTIDVFLISEPIIHKMAHALPEYHNKIVSDRVERGLKHMLETRSIQSLYSSDATYGPGVLRGLEQEICQRVDRQLSSPLNLGFRELRPKDVSLGPIQMPQTIEKMIELGLQTGIHV